jgi:hypothetical protein
MADLVDSAERLGINLIDVEAEGHRMLRLGPLRVRA